MAKGLSQPSQKRHRLRLLLSCNLAQSDPSCFLLARSTSINRSKSATRTWLWYSSFLGAQPWPPLAGPIESRGEAVWSVSVVILRYDFPDQTFPAGLPPLGSSWQRRSNLGSILISDVYSSVTRHTPCASDALLHKGSAHGKPSERSGTLRPSPRLSLRLWILHRTRATHRQSSIVLWKSPIASLRTPSSPFQATYQLTWTIWNCFTISTPRHARLWSGPRVS